MKTASICLMVFLSLVIPPSLTRADVEVVTDPVHVFGFPGELSSMAVSPNGSYVAVGGTSPQRNPEDLFNPVGRVWLIDYASGSIAGVFEGGQGPIESVAFSPDGARLLGGSRDGARLWDVNTKAEVRFFPGHTLAVAISPDGARVLTGNIAAARLWSVSTGGEIHSFGAYTLSVAFSPDGTHVLTGDWGHARLWNANTGVEVRSFGGPATSVAFSPDAGIHVLTGGDYRAEIWDTASGQLLHVLDDHRGIVTSVAFSPDGSRVLTGSRDGAVRVWNRNTGQLVQVLPENPLPPIPREVMPNQYPYHQVVVLGAAFSPENSRVLSLTSNLYHPTGFDYYELGQAVWLWNTTTATKVRHVTGSPYPTMTTHWAGTFSPDGSRVLITGGKTSDFDFVFSHSLLMDAHTGGLVKSWTFSGSDPTKPKNDQIAISPNSLYVLTGDSTPPYRAHLWDATTGNLVRSFAGHEGRLNFVSFSPDGKRFLTGSTDGTTRLWNVDGSSTPISTTSTWMAH